MSTTEQINSSKGSGSAPSLFIDTEDLIMALENSGDEMEYFLDMQTGEIVCRGDEAVVGRDEDLEMQLENEPDRFRDIAAIRQLANDGRLRRTNFVG